MFSFEGSRSSSSSGGNNTNGDGGKKRGNYYVPLSDVDAKSVNYYVPLPEVGAQSYGNGRNSVSLERRTVRILSRRYALTATEYKYLEIGVSVGPPSYVEIAVGDHRGKELTMSLETWKGLYAERQNIWNFLRDDCKDIHSFINVGPLTVRVCTSVNNVKLIRLESVNVRMVMTESTLYRMFNLDRCIDARFDQLIRTLAAVDAKFAQFSNIASTVTNPKEAANAIYASDAFNINQLLDCELVALVFST